MTNCGPFLCSISKFDERSAFLYVLHNAEDFQIYFCTEMHCKRLVCPFNVIKAVKWYIRNRDNNYLCPFLRLDYSQKASFKSTQQSLIY